MQEPLKACFLIDFASSCWPGSDWSHSIGYQVIRQRGSAHPSKLIASAKTEKSQTEQSDATFILAQIWRNPHTSSYLTQHSYEPKVQIQIKPRTPILAIEACPDIRSYHNFILFPVSLCKSKMNYFSPSHSKSTSTRTCLLAIKVTHSTYVSLSTEQSLICRWCWCHQWWP